MPQIPIQQAPSVGMTAQSPGPIQISGAVKSSDNIAAKQLSEFGRAASSASADMFKIATKLQDEVNDAKANEAFNNFSKAANDLELGYLSTQGRSAVDAFESSNAKAFSMLDEYSKGLENDTQRRVFENAANRRLQSINQRFVAHSIGEQRKYAQAESKSRIATYVENAGRYYDTRDIPNGDFDVYAGSAIKEANDYADSIGLAPDSEQRSQLINDTKSAIHYKVSENMISAEKYTDTIEYLEDAYASGEMGQQAYMQQMKVAKVGATKQLGIQFGQSIFEQAMQDPKMQTTNKELNELGATVPSLTKMNELIRERIIDPEERAYATAWVTEEYNQQVGLFKDAYNSNLFEAQKIAFAKPGGWKDVNPEMMAKLSIKDRNTLIKGPVREDDPETVLEITNNPDLMRAGSIEQYRHLLSEQTYLGFVKKGQSDESVRDATIDAEQFNKSLLDAGLFDLVKPNNNTDKKEVIRLKNDLQTRIDVAQDLKGQKLNLTEKQKILDAVMMDKVKVSGFFGDKTKFLFQIDTEDLPDAFVVVGDEEIKLGQIPAQIRSAISKNRMMSNLPVTEEAIAKTWVSLGKPMALK